MELNYQHLKRFRRTAHEFAVYINNNSGSLINYGERYRSGERISSAMAESTVNALVSKRSPSGSKCNGPGGELTCFSKPAQERLTERSDLYSNAGIPA